MNIGVVGCGSIATEAHLPALLERQTSVNAFYDVDPVRAANYQRHLAGALAPSPSWEAVVSAPDVELVILSTPPGAARLEMVRAALTAGKHVLVEKPMAATLEEADQMLAAARGSKQLLAVVNNYLFTPEIKAIRKFLEDGVVGELLFAGFEALGIGQGVVRSTSYQRNDTDFYSQPDSEVEYKKAQPWLRRSWRGRAATAAGGALMEYGIHVVAMAQLLFGRPASSVSAVLATLDDPALSGGTGEDFASVTWEYPGLGVALLSFSMAPFHFSPGQSHRHGGMHMLCSEGSISVEYGSLGTGPHDPAQRIIAKRGNEEWVIEFPKLTFAERRGQIFGDMFANVFDAISSGGVPIVSGELGRSVFEQMLGAYRAAAEGRRVELPMPTDDRFYRGGVISLERYARLEPGGDSGVG